VEAARAAGRRSRRQGDAAGAGRGPAAARRATERKCTEKKHPRAIARACGRVDHFEPSTRVEVPYPRPLTRRQVALPDPQSPNILPTAAQSENIMAVRKRCGRNRLAPAVWLSALSAAKRHGKYLVSVWSRKSSDPSRIAFGKGKFQARISPSSSVTSSMALSRPACPPSVFRISRMVCPRHIPCMIGIAKLFALGGRRPAPGRCGY